MGWQRLQKTADCKPRSGESPVITSRSFSSTRQWRDSAVVLHTRAIGCGDTSIGILELPAIRSRLVAESDLHPGEHLEIRDLRRALPAVNGTCLERTGLERQAGSPTRESDGLPCESSDPVRHRRDRRFDGKLFGRGIPDGVECRSDCAGFSFCYFAITAEAANDFRPCRPKEARLPARTPAIVRRTLLLIREGALDKGSVVELAARVGVSVRHLNRLLMQQVGASPLAIAQTRRLYSAKRLLDTTDLSLTEIAFAAGYGSVRRFNSAFKASYKKSPRELRRHDRYGLDGVDEITPLFKPMSNRM
jgi:AraC family transcriptional regulator of adaptative response/methylated-DNA-[protein]-cysteine methyltransferase